MNLETLAMIGKEVNYLGKDVTEMMINIYDRNCDGDVYTNLLDEIIKRATALKTTIEINTFDVNKVEWD